MATPHTVEGPQQLVEQLSGIDQALHQGCRLHGFISTGGLKVIRLEQTGGDELRGYGEHPGVGEALWHASEDFLAGGRDYDKVYGSKGLYPNYLTGSSFNGSSFGPLLPFDHKLDAWAQDDQIVVQISGSAKYEVPEEVLENLRQSHQPQLWENRGFTYRTSRYSAFSFGSEIAHTTEVLTVPEGKTKHQGYEYHFSKTGHGANFVEAALAAMAASAVE